MKWPIQSPCIGLVLSMYKMIENFKFRIEVHSLNGLVWRVIPTLLLSSIEEEYGVEYKIQIYTVILVQKRALSEGIENTLCCLN